MAPGASASPSAPFLPEGVLYDLLAVSLTGVCVLSPVGDPAGELVDFALAYLNPAAQRMTGLPERPGGTIRTRFPDLLANGVFAFYQRVYETGEAGRYDFNYQADGFDNYFRVAAQRSEAWLLVSFTDTGDHDRSPVEQALRAAQAGEQAARAEAEAQRRRFYEVLMQLPAPVATYYGPDHTYNFVNAEYRRYFPAQPLPGRSLREVLPEAAEQGVLAVMDRVYQTGVPAYQQELEVWLDFTGTGQHRQQLFLNLYYHPLRNAQGQVDGLLDFCYDVTEQVLARRQVHQRTQELEAARGAAERERGELARVFEQAPVAIAVYRGPRYLIELANPTVCRLWGRTAAQILGKGLFEALPEVAGMGYEELLDGVMATGVPHVAHAMEAQHDRNGQRETVYWNFVYEPMYEADGRISGVMVVATEVTAQVVARQQLEQLNEELERRVTARSAEARSAQHEAERQREQAREQQALLSQILGQVPAAIATLTGPQHRFSFFNDDYQTLVAGRAGLGQAAAEALPEVAEQGFIALLDQVYATGQPFVGTETAIILHDPRTAQPAQRYIDFVYQPLFDGQQRTQGILAFVVDVTDKVKARKQADTLQTALIGMLQRQGQERENVHQLFEQAPAAICLLRESDHRVEYLNPAYQALFPGLGLRGRTLGETQADNPALVALLDGIYQGGAGQFQAEVPVLIAQPGGQPPHTRYFDFTYQAYREQGDIAGVSIFGFDVTERRLAREQVQDLNHTLAATNAQLRATNAAVEQSNARLRRTNTDLDTFVYAASHDLKAPIANIEGLLDALREYLPPAAQEPMVPRLVGMMEGAITRFQQTVGHLTDVSHLQALGTAPPEAVNLAAVLEDVRLDLLPLLKSTHAELVLELAACPPVRIAAKHLRSVLFNLLSNALKYRAPDRAPRVQVRTHCTATHLVLDVADNGLGLNATQQGQLFTMFRRLHTHVEGSGVGLYLIKRTLENAGGTITVQSQPGVGSTFTVTIPRASRAQTPMEKLPHILLVDDDDTTNFLNENLLNKLRVSEQVQVATSGEQALALLTQPPPYVPTLLLLDVAMPGMGGVAFLEAFQQLPQAQQDATVVVVLTTSMDSRDLARIDELPIAGLATKPLNRDKVNTLLQLHFQRQLPTE